MAAPERPSSLCAEISWMAGSLLRLRLRRGKRTPGHDEWGIAPYTKGGIAKFRLQPRHRRRLRRPLSHGDRQAHWSHSAECSSRPSPCDAAVAAIAAGLTRSSRDHGCAARAGAILLYLRRFFRPKPKIALHCQTPRLMWVCGANNSIPCDNRCVLTGERQMQ
jgi:hypothetical protein